jgi:hypothetical protein
MGRYAKSKYQVSVMQTIVEVDGKTLIIKLPLQKPRSKALGKTWGRR